MIRKTLAAGALCIAAAAPARAVDSYAFEAGHGDDDANLFRAGVQWKWHWKARERHRFHLSGYWDLAFGAWGKDHTVYDLGLTPVFRLQREDGPGPYAEGAVGFHVVSRAHVSRTKIFSTRFQFGDHIGIGYRFGGAGKYDVSLRVQHLSNAGIDRPNPGINFLQLRLQVHR